MLTIIWTKDLKDYEALENYKLTENEIKFVEAHCRIANSECGADSFEDLYDDNFSCANVEDFQDKGYNAQQVGGFVSSLAKKRVIIIEERDGDCDLYWLDDSFVEAMAKGE